jgi:hypothetical protein
MIRALSQIANSLFHDKCPPDSGGHLRGLPQWEAAADQAVIFRFREATTPITAKAPAMTA